MALSNAQRQARFRERQREEQLRRIGPGDIEAAARLWYEAVHAAWPQPGAPDFDTWKAAQASLPGGGRWADFVPDDPDPSSYAGIAPEHAEFLANVGAVVAAARHPAWNNT
ncbi:hypothetical protein [Qipengyuania sp.]|uniref:hypothetical protein n=1 Tax=Qipengyuania sp. TaxID=2004515 RepID=UPI0035C799F8